MAERQRLTRIGGTSDANDDRTRLLFTLSRRTVDNDRLTLSLPTFEEVVFCEPHTVSLNIRALIVLCVRHR